jgi:tetratricopeptide (TPR) repeat protein
MLNPQGRFACVALTRAEKVKWIIRRGAEVLWHSTSEPRQFASIEIPSAGLAPGTYQLEAVTETEARSVLVTLGKGTREERDVTPISFNANLAPARRYAFVGHQWLLRGNVAEARKSLAASLAEGATLDAQIELARVDVVGGRLDEARDRLRRVLAVRPDEFQALSVLAYIETRFQDYTVAAELYRRAIAVEESPALRMALSKLPNQ